jgi:hypothetical protein
MKNILKKTLITAAVVGASFGAQATEIGNVQVDANYVSTCTVTNAPVANFVDIVPGTLPTADVTIDIECSASSDDSEVTLWLKNTQLYADDADHFVVFVAPDYVITQDRISTADTLTFGDGNPNENAPVTTLTPGTNSYTVSLKAALGIKSGTQYNAPTVYDAVSLQVPVNVQF